MRERERGGGGGGGEVREGKVRSETPDLILTTLSLDSNGNF